MLTFDPDARRARISLWGAKTPSVSVGLTPWVGTARSERHKQRVRDPQPATLCVISRCSGGPAHPPFLAALAAACLPNRMTSRRVSQRPRYGRGFSTAYPSGAKRNLSS
jgi:hypothetical protein